MLRQIVLILALATVWGAAGDVQVPPRSDVQAVARCTRGAERAEVTVEEWQDGVFRYTLHNHHSHPARIFALGRGERREMLALDANTPLRVDSPKGWEGSVVSLHESAYQQVFWHTPSVKQAVAPGEVLTGFALKMPPRNEPSQELLTPGGEVATSLNMERAPFEITFSDGKCAWGRVSGSPAKGGQLPPETNSREEQ